MTAGAAPIVRIVDVVAGYGGEPVLDDLDLTIGPGELVGAVGPSGAGKTTFLRLLTGQVPLYRGSVEVNGERVVEGSRPVVGYVPQLDLGDRQFPLTVRGAVLLGLTATGRPGWRHSPEEQRRADDAIERLGISHLAARSLAEISGGQYQRVLIARALVSGARLLLLDEPTSGLDLQVRHDLLALLDDLTSEGLTIVLTTHDLNWVAAHLPRIVWINGHIVADGPPAATFTEPVLRQTYGADVTVIRHGDTLLIADAASPMTARRAL
jgi:zinc/manganese transport system ATP-binding protein